MDCLRPPLQDFMKWFVRFVKAIAQKMDRPCGFAFRKWKFGTGNFDACNILHIFCDIRFCSWNSGKGIVVSNRDTLYPFEFRLIKYFFYREEAIRMFRMYMVIDFHADLLINDNVEIP